ncbi:MAG: ATP-binding cassette domain-containing protein [Akkermansiaceae bacterium]|nr:ATP-binding cassette domain-containing protein [Akkermansiaceae bacterium]
MLEDFNYGFDPGIALLKGYSGCGKSTLLRLLGGLLEPSAGRIVAEGMPTPGSREFLRHAFAMVFQELNLLPLASVSRNIELSCQIAGVPLERGNEWLGRLGMERFSNRRVESLSGGQKQRVAIARAMAKSPLLLLLDEPTSGLDDENADIILSAIRQFSESRDAICVIASHDYRMDPVANELVDFHSHVSVAQ